MFAKLGEPPIGPDRVAICTALAPEGRVMDGTPALEKLTWATPLAVEYTKTLALTLSNAPHRPVAHGLR
jgi:hypothetical protein